MLDVRSAWLAGLDRSYPVGVRWRLGREGYVMEFFEIAGAVALGGTVATVAGNFLFGAIIMNTAKRTQAKKIQKLSEVLKQAKERGDLG